MLGLTRRARIQVNGAVYTRLEIIGRGGSSKVFRVVSDAGKIFALKRSASLPAPLRSTRGLIARVCMSV
jgi:serine/threonine-protein kinase TTK/MPS1